MNTGHVALAVVVSGIAVSLTDWVFFGVLFHDKYLVHPEVWRSPGKGEAPAIIGSTLLGFVTCGAFVTACPAFHIAGIKQTLEFALAAWLIAPLPLLITNALFIKLHPLTVLAHALGWLAKLCVVAVVTAVLVA
jgi:hypothetical protein